MTRCRQADSRLPETTGIRYVFTHLETDGFFAWAADDGHGRGACGVTGDLERAYRLLHDAMDTLPQGAQGTLTNVRLDMNATHPAYIYGRVLMLVSRKADK